MDANVAVGVVTIAVSVGGSAALLLWSGGRKDMRLETLEKGHTEMKAALKEHEEEDAETHKVIQKHGEMIVAVERDVHAAKSREQTMVIDLGQLKQQAARTYEAVIRIEERLAARGESTGKHERNRDG